MPPAVALLNYISCGIHWRTFCHSGIFRGVSSSHIKIKIKNKILWNRFLNSFNVYKYGLWSQGTVGAQEYDYAMSILHNDYRANLHWSEHVDIFPVRLVPTFH